MTTTEQDGYPIFTKDGVVRYRPNRLGCSRPVVEISAEAKRSILDHATRDTHSMLESGGGLFTTSNDFTSTTITAAKGPGRRAKRRRWSLEFDRVEMEDQGAGHRMIGFWHSHPNGGLSLSTPDIACLQRLRRSIRRPVTKMVAVLVAPADPARGWDEPQIAVWLVGNGYYERAKLTVAPPRATRKTPTADPKLTSRRREVPMLVATRTFDTTYDGERLRITAGADRLRADHEIAQRHPEAFKREPARTRQAQRIPGR